MQAKHGSTFWGRRRSYLIGCAMGLAALFALTMPSFASAQPTETYVGLGDSLAFGFSSQLYHEGEAKGFEDPEGFHRGYVDAYFKALNGKAQKVSKLYRVRNDGCPGETTETMIGENPVIIGTLNSEPVLGKTQKEKGLPPVKGSNKSNPAGQDKEPCEYQAAWNAGKKVGTGGPLHHPYSGSQLEDAIALIKTSATEGKPVTALTLNIGANDELHVLGAIEKEAETVYAPKYFGEHKAELEAEGKQEAGEQYFKHKAKYDKEGEEAYKEHEAEWKAEAEAYAFKKCSEKAKEENGGTEEEPEYKNKREACLTGPEGEKFFKDAIFAKAIQPKLEAYGKKAIEFKVGAAAQAFASEQIKAAIPGLFGQISSNLLGILTAIRKAGTLGFGGVDYFGKIMFQGGYNPFGKQFKFAFEGVKFVAELGTATEPRELKEKKEIAKKLSGRCAVHASKLEGEEEAIAGGCTAAALAIGFNGLVGVLNGHEEDITNGSRACMTAPLIRFNPQNEKEAGALEAGRLKDWTGMTNAVRTKVGTEERFNAADIHPTPAGYMELKNEMVKEENNRCHKVNEEKPGTYLGF